MRMRPQSAQPLSRTRPTSARPQSATVRFKICFLFKIIVESSHLITVNIYLFPNVAKKYVIISERHVIAWFCNYQPGPVKRVYRTIFCLRHSPIDQHRTPATHQRATRPSWTGSKTKFKPPLMLPRHSYEKHAASISIAQVWRIYETSRTSAPHRAGCAVDGRSYVFRPAQVRRERPQEHPPRPCPGRRLTPLYVRFFFNLATFKMRNYFLRIESKDKSSCGNVGTFEFHSEKKFKLSHEFRCFVKLWVF